MKDPLADPGHVLLPTRVGVETPPPLLSLVEMLIAPQVHHLIEGADLGGEIPDQVAKMLPLYIQTLLDICSQILRRLTGLERVRPLFNKHVPIPLWALRRSND